MTEMDPRRKGIDDLLRRTLAAPAPTLPPEFDRRVLRALRQNSPLLDRYRRVVIAGYGLASAVTCAVVMRG